MRWRAAALTALVALITGASARGEQSERIGTGMEVRQLQVEPDLRFEDARGIKLSFRYRVGRVAANKALFMVARVTTAGDQKIRSLVESAVYRDRDGFVHGKKQLVTVPRFTWREETIFIPYYTMKLPPGRQGVKVQLEAVSDAGSCKTGELPEKVAILGEDRAQVTIDKPEYKMIQLLVRRIAVKHLATDAALILRYKRRPDLQWRARFRAGAGGVVHNSDTRDNVWQGRWRQYTDPFPFSRGDRLTLTVFDEDFMGDDEMGRFSLTLEEIEQLGSRPAPLSAGRVVALELAPVKVR